MTANLQPIQCGYFGAGLVRVNGLGLSVDQEFMESVFGIGSPALGIEQFAGVGLILGEQPLRSAAIRTRSGDEEMIAEINMFPLDGVLIKGLEVGADPTAFMFTAPGPGIPIPERWQDVQRDDFLAAVGNANADEDVIGMSLGIFHLHIEVSARVKDTCFLELEFGFLPASSLI